MAAPMKKTVELFYDVVSPYTWIGFEVLCRYRTKWPNMDLQLKPFFLGGVMKESGNKPPAMVPNKGSYMIKDIQRLGKYYGIPLKQPKDFASVMFGTLPVQRFLTAVDMTNPEYTEELSRQFWFRIWKNDEPVTEPQHFAEAAKKAGMSEDDISSALKRMSEPDVKNRLTQYTKQALDDGAFGSPWIIAHINGKKESVFGSDRFPILAMLLGKIPKSHLWKASSSLAKGDDPIHSSPPEERGVDHHPWLAEMEEVLIE
ncbi:glutathione S-transferase kappa 1-like [Saccostrea cucullata]|uniref:glutathione S-transferase kappa 1-like n=1 Tax=Saccostrea cuccullata TaxID=36930 RepID=UPI002ED68AB7